MTLAYYNKLPARPEYVSKVEEALKGGGSYQLMDLIRLSRLTRTQTLCALDELLLKDLIGVSKDGGVVRYFQKIPVI